MSRRREIIDIYELKVLHAVVTERSITRAADKLNQSQSQVSVALRRLRTIAGDPILVRGKRKMVPTEYGLQLYEAADFALREIQFIAHLQHEFDPGHSRRIYRVGCPDCISTTFVPRLVALFRDAAPHATLECSSAGLTFDYESALQRGELDVVIGSWTSKSAQLRRVPLFEDDTVCVVSDDHPFARSSPVSLDGYVSARHLVSMSEDSHHRHLVEQVLQPAGKARNVVATIHADLAPYVLVSSDLVLTTSRFSAARYVQFQRLAIVRAPARFGRVSYFQWWHERSASSKEVRWLRDLIAKVSHSLFEASVHA
ncbi:PCP degradation transcriptional activation protein [Paraburkholderia domus]|jgi:Transcriptional regulator|uniref:LysR family transcriptional regulator n=1 Tax=Paraburkholderia domus TaxID=2793075 RepID=UPI001911CF73|nr:LysR family transcriptional regulator [Paraburkholderia domus]MBK5090878.1 LysR family transcriptional regulator [Burkholderia sp. R-69927]CAE6925034.1 PCP degradation transcriptional activation protein [Paraburkholderia domus]